MRMKSFAILGFVAVLTAFVAFPGRAEDKPSPFLAIEKTEASRYDRLDVARAYIAHGLRQTLEIQGKKLVGISAVIYPEWSDEVSSFRIDPEDIKLIGGQGEIMPMVGYFERVGVFDLSPNGLSGYRRSDWKETRYPLYYNAVFAAPDSVTNASLFFGKNVAGVTFPPASAPAPDPLSTVSIAVLETRIVNQVRNQARVANMKPNPFTVITKPDGMLLEIKVRLTPQKNNGDHPDNFFWTTNWFGVYTGDGQYIRTIGEAYMEKVSDSVSHNLNRGAGGEWGASEATLYFALPASTTAYQLVYLGKAVSQGEISPTPKAAPEKPAETPQAEAPPAPAETPQAKPEGKPKAEVSAVPAVPAKPAAPEAPPKTEEEKSKETIQK